MMSWWQIDDALQLPSEDEEGEGEGEGSWEHVDDPAVLRAEIYRLAAHRPTHGAGWIRRSLSMAAASGASAPRAGGSTRTSARFGRQRDAVGRELFEGRIRSDRRASL